MNEFHYQRITILFVGLIVSAQGSWPGGSVVSDILGSQSADER